MIQWTPSSTYCSHPPGFLSKYDTQICVQHSSRLAVPAFSGGHASFWIRRGPLWEADVFLDWTDDLLLAHMREPALKFPQKQWCNRIEALVFSPRRLHSLISQASGWCCQGSASDSGCCRAAARIHTGHAPNRSFMKLCFSSISVGVIKSTCCVWSVSWCCLLRFELPPSARAALFLERKKNPRFN